VSELLGYALPIALFVILYALLRERERRRTGFRRPIQWGWLAAIAACALVAILAGLVF
jgi:lysylphosphatidylglycerol synthetase-like protein (DUF2156 family)